EVSRIKEEFVANASHELKTPIASIRLAAESALRSLKLNDGMVESFLEQILRDSDRMNDLVTDLLDLSSLESSEVDFEMIDLNDVVLQEISYLSKINKKRVGYKKTKNSFVIANFDDVSIAFKNLLRNALKYSPVEENVFVKITSIDDEIICSVQDFGSGIAKLDQEKIFERFFRVDKGRSRKLGGTGLGLAIVKHAIERNNAKVAVESSLGFGSTFSLKFKKVNAK
ncbi:MAG: ATP-binding protein, partial [Actinomycetota bacterium]|nr:ATP-binding protein [Actinomycetota bacterium]